MKKLSYLFSGALIGAAVMLTTSAYGADIAALVGKKVQGETDIVVEGVPVEKAIIIDGKSYAPVRSVAELGGFNVEFKDKKVILSGQQEAPTQGETVTPASPGGSVEEPAAPLRLEYVVSEIERLEISIMTLNYGISASEQIIAENPNNSEVIDFQKSRIDDSKKNLLIIEQRLAEFEALKEELESK